MAIATHSSTATEPAAHGPGGAHTHVRHAPVTPGKVAMWLFLATEVMFFTGLIGSYIVLRAGSPHTAYSNIYPPATPLKGLEEMHGVVLQSPGADRTHVEHLLESAAGLSAEKAEEVVHQAPHGMVGGLSKEKAEALLGQLKSAGAEAEAESLKTYHWPLPYDELINPLAINLTAANTFILICSSVTMVLALAAFQDGKKAKGSGFLLATVLIGSTFLSVQVYEYYQLMYGHHYPPGISATGHFRPSVSLFASCFFTMTGFHGAHVTGGVILLSMIWLRSLTGVYSATNYSPVELAGLYWHFVDLVWIILFTIVYLL
jgi:heme/copper-type cytochrome/quinol oxidase subunit 3